MNEISDFNLTQVPHSEQTHLVYDGKYFLLSKVKKDHRWEIVKTIQEKEKNNPVCIRSLQKEFEIGSQLQHHGIVHYYSYNKANSQLVREFINGTTWLDFFENNTRENLRIKKYVKELIEIIKYLHINGTYHMDIKSENILVTHATKQIKLIDFGHAEQSNSTLTVGGTKLYQPITENGKGFHDVYALGKLLEMTSQISDIHNKRWLQKIANHCTQANSNTKNAIQLSFFLEKKYRRIKKVRIFIFTAIVSLTLLLSFYLTNTTEEKSKINTNNIVTTFDKEKVILKNTELPFQKEFIEKNRKKTGKMLKNTEFLTANDTIIIYEKSKNFGPEFEKEYFQYNLEQSTYAIYSRLLEKYDNIWQEISVNWTDSIQKSNAKQLFDKQIMMSLKPYQHYL